MCLADITLSLNGVFSCKSCFEFSALAQLTLGEGRVLDRRSRKERTSRDGGESRFESGLGQMTGGIHCRKRLEGNPSVRFGALVC